MSFSPLGPLWPTFQKEYEPFVHGYAGQVAGELHRLHVDLVGDQVHQRGRQPRR
jgi:hypothetical protein